MNVHYADGALSLSAENQSLREVLQAIDQTTGINIKTFGDLSEVVSDHFAEIPLARAIRRLAKKHNVLMFYEARGTDLAIGQLKEVRVHAVSAPKVEIVAPTETAARSRRCATPRCIRNQSEFDDGVIDQEVEARRRSMALLARRGGYGAMVRLEQAMRDDEPIVRLQAIRGLYRVDRENAAVTLGEAATQDDDAEVRLTAIQMLAQIDAPESRFALAEAANDPEPDVRQAALLALGAIEARLGGE